MKKDFSKQDMLVSVIVVTYNSGSTVTETLDSIKQQVYENIELIISDDCSKDDTVAICREWLDKNKPRFVKAELITVNQNTGVCANFNRANAVVKGEWIKEIAGDDILLPNCVSDFVDYVRSNPEVKWVSSYMRIYNNFFTENNCIRHHSVSKRSFFNLSANQQLKKMALWNTIAAPSVFYKASLKKEIGDYDITYSFEDSPYYLKILENGYKCFFMDKETVGYRVHDSTSHSSRNLFNYSFLLESKKFHKERCFKYLSWWQKLGQYSIWSLQYTFEKLNLNRDTRFLRLIYKNTYSLLRKLFNN